jgi:iron complex outermembrane receptor protein
MRMSSASLRVWLLSASSAMAAATVLPAAPALAQDGAQASDEIIVSARRRDESLQDVPAAVTAVSGAQLEKLGAADLTYLTQTTPNTTLKVSRGTNSTLTAFIRGIGQQDPVAGFESGVGIYLDDVYLNRPQGAVLDIYDVERIEILRGPQGTLYGRNTIGGAVKYVTKRLGDDPMLRLRASGGTYGQRDFVGTAALPLSDEFAIGGSVAYLKRNGYGENLTTGAENYDKDILAFRASAEYDSGDLFIRLSGDYLRDHSSPKGGHRLIPGMLSGAPVLSNVFDSRGGLVSRNEAEVYGGALHVELKLDDRWTIKNIAAYREDENWQSIDFDALPAADVDVPVVYANKQWTEELQLLYQGDSVAGVLGFFYIDANAYNTFDVLLFTSLPGLNANTTGNVDTKSWALFGDVSFDLDRLIGVPNVEVAVGLRYTEDKRSSQVLRRTFLTGATPPFGGTSTVPLATTSNFDGEVTFTDWSPRASISWKPHPDHNLYASYAKGFKGGSFDPRGQTSSVFANNLDINGDGVVDAQDVFLFMMFEPEKVETYEAGWKARFAEGRITSNVAFFYSDYTNVQIPGSQGGIDPITGLPTFLGVTTNAGAAEMYGIEWEGSALMGQDMLGAGDSLTFSWGAGWIHAEYTEFVTGAPPVDVSDLRVIQNTPKWSGAVTANYTHPVGAGDLSWITTASYKSRTHQFEVPNAFLDQGGYGLLDSSLVWTSNTGRLQLALHGKNLLDRRYRVAGYNFLAQNQNGSFIINPITSNVVSTLGLEGVITAFYGPPRTITGTITVQF